MNEMNNNFEDPLEFEVLAAGLHLNNLEAKQMIETLARILESSLPDLISITRSGWFLSKERPIEDLTIKFDDTHYQISKQGKNQYVAKSLKVVRGVALKSNDIEFSQCIQEIVQELTKLANRNSNTKVALQKFLNG